MRTNHRYIPIVLGQCSVKIYTLNRADVLILYSGIFRFYKTRETTKRRQKKRTYSDATRTTPSPHTQPPTHPFLPHPPGNSCQLAPVHPFLLNTMQGRKHLPSLLKTNQPTGLPCWAKNFQAKFLMFRGLTSQSVSQLAGSRKVTPCQHLCHCTLSQSAALDCCAEKQKQNKKRCVITVSSTRCGLQSCLVD